jgi:hypothetical protein
LRFDDRTRVRAIAVAGIDVDWALSAPFTANGIARRRPALALDGAVRAPPRCLRVEPPVRVRRHVFQIGHALVEPVGGCRQHSDRPADACTDRCCAKERAKRDAACSCPRRLLGCQQRLVEHCWVKKVSAWALMSARATSDPLTKVPAHGSKHRIGRLFVFCFF